MAAVAPLSGFIFKAIVFEQAEAAKAKGNYPAVPVYMAAGTEGGTEWSICPVPLAEENSSGKTLSDWFALNDCTGSLDWSKINGSNETKGSLDWQNGGAFTKSGRWYTMTCEKDGVPMVQAEIVDYMPHATMPEPLCPCMEQLAESLQPQCRRHTRLQSVNFPSHLHGRPCQLAGSALSFSAPDVL